jgi:hypothetical protein
MECWNGLGPTTSTAMSTEPGRRKRLRPPTRPARSRPDLSISGTLHRDDVASRSRGPVWVLQPTRQNESFNGRAEAARVAQREPTCDAMGRDRPPVARWLPWSHPVRYFRGPRRRCGRRRKPGTPPSARAKRLSEMVGQGRRTRMALSDRLRLVPKFLTAANSPSVCSSPAVTSLHRLGTGDVTVSEAAFCRGFPFPAGTLRSRYS